MYCGNLPEDIREREIEDMFSKVSEAGVPERAKHSHRHDGRSERTALQPLHALHPLPHQYGRILLIDLKTPPRPPAFCFIEYSDPRSVHSRNGAALPGKLDGELLWRAG